MTVLTKAFANTTQCRFFYVESGRGRAVLLLHGGLGTHHDWSQLFPLLAPGLRAIAPDLPGFGQTTRPREGYGRTTVGRSLAELVYALGEERVSVVAHGIGGFLAVELAAAVSHAVDRLVLIAPVVGGIEGRERRLALEEAIAERQLYDAEGDVSRRAEHIAESFLQSAAARRRFVDAAAEYGANTDPAAAEQILSFAGSVNDAALLGSFRCPTMVVRGESDATFSRARADRIAALIPVARVVEIPDGGHFIHLEQPSALAEAILPFLSSR